jgi:predicted amidohydrolase
MHSPRDPVCSCQLHRRRFLQLAGGAGLAAAFPFSATSAPDVQYEALLLICSEPRVWQHANNYMKSRQLVGKYQPVEVDGAAIGLVAEQYQASRQAFWETLTSAAAWQQTTKVIALNHRDCSAMKTAYGLTKIADKLIETETHRYALTEFRKKVAERNADLDVEIGLIGLDGKVEMFK